MISSWKKISSISGRAGLLLMNPLSICWSGNVLISAFGGDRIMINNLFTFWICHCLLVSIVSDEKLWCFFFPDFKILCGFYQFEYNMSRCGSLRVHLIWSLSIENFERCQPLLLSLFFLTLPPLLSFQDSYYVYVGTLDGILRVFLSFCSPFYF